MINGTYDESESIAEEPTEQKVIIFDGMAVLNKLKLVSGIRNCLQLAEQFLKMVMSEPSDEIRVVFDRYIEDSLKKTTRNKRQGKLNTSTQYEIKEDTNLEKTNITKLLSRNQTKHQLTLFLERFLARKLREINVKFAVSFGKCTLTNIQSLDTEKLNGHNHEEAGTLGDPS